MTFKDYWIEVFKTGTHTDSGGNVMTFTKEDLDKIVSSYNQQPEADRHEAPVVIGHPEENHPAYGWTERLKMEGETMFAKLHDMTDEFVEWVKKGLYKKRSIAIYPDGTLRHIGFLGAVPPAIKGLADPVFKADSEFSTYEYRMSTKTKPDPQLSTDKVLQTLRARKYGIEIKEGKRFSKPVAYQRLTDEEFADPTHYSLPLTSSHIHATLATWNRKAIRGKYTEREQTKIAAKIILAARHKGIKLTPFKWAYSEWNKVYQQVGEFVATGIKTGVAPKGMALAEFIEGYADEGQGGQVNIPIEMLTRVQLIDVVNDFLRKQNTSNISTTNMEEMDMVKTITVEHFETFKVGLLAFVTETFPEDIGQAIGAKIEELGAAVVVVDTEDTPAEGEGAPAPALAEPPKFEESKEYKEMAAKVLVLETDKRLSDFSSYADKMVTSGVMIPAQKNILLSCLEMGNTSGTIKFSEADDKGVLQVVDKPGVDAIKTLVESFPKQVEFNEQASKAAGSTGSNYKGLEMPSGKGNFVLPTDSGVLDTHTKVVTFQEEQLKAGKEVTYREALDHIKIQARG